MVDRNDIGSWLGGSPSNHTNYWPGQGMGRPKEGPAAIARPARRVGALLLDWALSSLISYLFFDYNSFATLGVFAVTQILLVGFFGYSIGHRIMGMQVQTVSGRPAGYGKAAVRTLLICLVIPALIVDRDQRGVHDRAVQTVLVRI
ncbi:putative RDD family membrane protein YckC [Arthrobacter sp. CAN_A212]|uniref:RDD family protein n=1 Tax=Arthrobacter sp. CAN_A212 TaxID=2787719 RepID=UPI0018C9748A